MWPLDGWAEPGSAAGADSALAPIPNHSHTHMHAHAHARTHTFSYAHTHAHTHTRTRTPQAAPSPQPTPDTTTTPRVHPSRGHHRHPPAQPQAGGAAPPAGAGSKAPPSALATRALGHGACACEAQGVGDCGLSWLSCVRGVGSACLGACQALRGARARVSSCAPLTGFSPPGHAT